MNKILLALILLVPMPSCDTPKHKLPKAPKGTWWDARDPLNDGAYLMANNGVRIGAFEGNQAWLFECGNQSLIFQTRDQAVQAVVLCALQGQSEVGCGQS